MVAADRGDDASAAAPNEGVDGGLAVSPQGRRVAALFFVLMSYAFSIGYGEKAVSEGLWAFSPGPVSEMATLYVGSWFATLLEIVVILDAMALALAICVVIGRGFFALGRDGLLPSFFAKTSRRDTPWVGNLMVAVGGIGLTLLVFATNYASQFGFVDEAGAFVPFFPNDQFEIGRAHV